MRSLAFIAVILASSLCSLTASAGDAWLQFSPSFVTLEGHFELVVRFGPPNYGEDPKTDLQMDVPVIWLAEPIRVRGRPGDEINADSVEGVRMVQLSLPSKIKPYDFIDRSVVVKGQLNHATRGPEFTPIIMDVTQIELAP